MRCKICEIPHKNTAKYDLWLEHKICRVCKMDQSATSME